MANTLTGDVWAIDTVGALVATGTPVEIWSFLWTCITVLNSRVQVTDAGGRVVFEDGGFNCGRFVAYTQAINLNGLSVPYIVGGRLFIQVG